MLFTTILLVLPLGALALPVADTNAINGAEINALSPRAENTPALTSVSKRADSPFFLPQPVLPTFIDSGTCLCGLLLDQGPNPQQQIIEKWRCTASGNHDITKGGNGKWYDTLYPSQDRSGVNMGREWDQNQPTVTKTFVLTFKNGKGGYEVLNEGNKGALFGADRECTGVKNEELSEAWYEVQSAPKL